MLTDSSAISSSGRNGTNILQIVGKMGGRMRSKGENHERDAPTSTLIDGSVLSRNNTIKKSSEVSRAISLDSNGKIEQETSSQIPSHYAKLSLFTIHNALHMGARTQVHLCPPKLRDDLIKALKTRKQKQKKSMTGPRRGMLARSASVPIAVVSKSDDCISFEKWVGEARLEEYEKEEDDFLSNPRKYSLNYEDELKEGCSSGDEESMDVAFDDDDLSTRPSQSPSGHNKYSTAGVPDNYIPLNLRKIKWFDSISTADRMEARQYLKGEIASMKQKTFLSVTKFVDDKQGRENKKLSENSKNGLMSETKFGKLPSKMTPKLAAALVLESLALNRTESIEGMARCYDAIVTMGTALLETDTDQTNDRDSSIESTEEKMEKKKPSRTEMKIDLSLLLKVTLEQTSGEVILALARLRKLCATKQYQRRFVQRVAPYLVRPPGAAMWCLRHLEDMKAIFSATEMIMDSAFEIFPPGWHVVRNNILAESKIKENLTSAAERLKQLSAPQPLDDLMKNFGIQKRVAGYNTSAISSKDGNEAILLVDRQIRQSINSLFTKDWSVQRREKPSHTQVQQDQGDLRVYDSPTVAPSPSHSNLKLLLSPPRLTTSHHLETDDRSNTGTIKNDTLKASNGFIPDGTISPPMTPKYNHEQNHVNMFDHISSSSPTRSMMVTDSNTTSPTRKSTPLSPVSAYESTANSTMVSHHFTMTPADRKKTVAATRAIRQQIVRFEENFQKIHGRKPHGPKERAPLLSTYAQYRDWKRAIRSDAACRMQAFFRGARIRRRFRPFIQHQFVEDVFEGENGSAFEVHPHTPIIHMERNINIVEIAQELEMLKMKKKELKDLLKAYDRDWYKRTGRMPIKAEKEPIRHLYEQYNVLKSKIKEIDLRLGGGTQMGEGSPTNSDAPVAAKEMVIPLMVGNNLTALPSAVIAPLPVSSIIESPNAVTPIQHENQSISSELEQLLNEKQLLHRQLRNYEKEFSRTHGRQVSSFEDIRPVARQYRKYKEIKKAIAARQGASNATYLEDRYELTG